MQCSVSSKKIGFVLARHHHFQTGYAKDIIVLQTGHDVLHCSFRQISESLSPG